MVQGDSIVPRFSGGRQMHVRHTRGAREAVQVELPQHHQHFAPGVAVVAHLQSGASAVAVQLDGGPVGERDAAVASGAQDALRVGHVPARHVDGSRGEGGALALLIEKQLTCRRDRVSTVELAVILMVCSLCIMIVSIHRKDCGTTLI